ncbi:hypothetical protein [Clostridium botulinum]|uniref:hypothetical protein n=1 Tax=Clostridium botulinum TaxID=1491 RepID=UPI00249EEEBC|nr:hypothetical protein [Clostridium botulinum]MDU4596483.1 hypothetical protein [Clostridium sporogenes]WGZ48116.1 hypothetical protein HEQ52_18390 [Clostridium botulinum]
MAKQLISLRLRDMYAIKHSLQNVVRQKKQELDFIKQQGKSEDNIKIEQLESDIDHEEWLVQKMVNEIEDFKLDKGIN